MKQNPFDKYLTKEDHLHLQVVEYLRWQYPNVLFGHWPNEGKRSPFERYKAKKLGMVKGWPDIMIFKQVDFPVDIKLNEYWDYNGLAIELKIKPNKLTNEQIEILQRLDGNNWYTKVCYTFDEAKETIDFYLGGKG